MIRLAALAILGFAWAVPLPAGAQGFDAQIFRPAGSTSGYFSQESAHVIGNNQLNVGLALDYAHNPLVIRDHVTGEILPDGGVIADRLAGHLVISYGLLGVLEARLSVPFVAYQDGTLADLPSSASLDKAAFGDMRLLVKAGLVGAPDRDGFQLALAADVGLPTGRASNFSGDDGVSFRPRLIIGFEHEGLSTALSAGYDVRHDQSIGTANIKIGDDVMAGLGLGYALLPRRLWAQGEVYLTRTVSGDAGIRTTPTEMLLGARYALPGPWMLQGAFGVGLTSGVGAPAERVLLMLAYASDLRPPPPPPVIPPPSPPVVVAPPAPPPPVDTDGDGILDNVDKCPNDPEDKDGWEDEDGCPDPDNDGDGVADAADKCPNEPEDKDNFEDEDGCPDPDNDKDGFLDAVDKCPDAAEIFNGFEDDDGCPDQGPALAVMTGNKIEITQQVNFATSKAVIQKSSFKLLATVAKIMTLHPELSKITVEGHTDNSGAAQKNMKLSQDRADAVRKHLVEVNGIEPARLESVGYGPNKPIASNATKKGRAQNRRVEFVWTR